MPIRSPHWLARLGRLLLMSMLACVALELASPPTPSAWAQRGAKKKRKKRGKKVRRLKLPVAGSLAPRAAIDLDDEISKTRDPLEDFGADDGPSLTPFELRSQGLEALVEDKLDEEIELTLQLLSIETGCEDASPVRFRLADLYWEKSKRAFFKSEDFERSEAERKKFRKFMKGLQSRTAAYYNEIVEKCDGYSETAKVLYYLGKTLIEIGRARQGAFFFKRIIQEFAGSPWEAQAWFMVGEYYFNEEKKARQAFKAYSRAAAFNDSPIYGFAVFKQGWCHINTGDWDLALDRFKTVLRISDDAGSSLNDKGRRSLRKEALKDLVRAYSHVGEPDKAFQNFKRLGAGDYVPTMLELLGQWYLKRDAHREVITTYRTMIKQYSTSTRLPIFQGRIVTAASKMGDPKFTLASAKTLSKYFERVRRQTASGRLSGEKLAQAKKDLKEGEGIAENILRGLATDFHKRAQKTSGKTQMRDYRYARELYSHYLEVFPKPKPNATVNYVFFMRYRYANVLFAEESFLKAATNYEAVVDMNPNPAKKKDRLVVLRAAEDAVRAYDELVSDLDRKNPPVIGGNTIKPIPKIKKRLINACKRYIKYVGAEGDRIVEIRYKMARIYYTYNHLNLAAPAFHDIVKNHPGNEVACYAANLALDIYNGAKDYAALRRSARSYARNSKLACTAKDEGGFREIEEQATFLLIKKQYEAKKLYVKAGNAFMDFYRQYKGSKFAIEAVYNSAVNYDLGQRLDKANDIREFLVKTFSNSTDVKAKKIVKDTTYDIAGSFERVVDFRKAAKYLSAFAAKYPEDKRTKDAVFNAGLYLATLRDFSGARSARQKFLDLYPRDKDAAQVKFSMCTTMEQEATRLQKRGDKRAQNAWADAEGCFADWAADRSYGRKSPDLLCQAQFRRSEIMSRLNNTRGARDQVRYLKKMWPLWSRSVGSMPRCATAIAEINFRALEPGLKTYRGLTLSEVNPTEKGKRKYDASVATKTRARNRLIAGYKDVVAVGVAEWALAALFMIGEAHRDLADKFLGAPIPVRLGDYVLTAEDKQGVRNKLQAEALVPQNLAIEAYLLAVDKANELGVYNTWSARAYTRLQSLDPETYAPLVERIPKLNFVEPLQVAHTGVVIREGERLKALSPPFKKGIGPPAATESKQPDEESAADDDAVANGAPS